MNGRLHERRLSRRNLRPLVTLACRAHCTTRSFIAWTVSGCKVCSKPPERTGIGHRMKGHSAEPTQYQTVFDPPFYLFVAPLREVFEDEHT